MSMSAHLAPSQDDDNVADLTESPGRRLRHARQAQGIDVGRVASELHLSSAMIELLEQDDYDALPGRVFIVGYIRKYARVVGLDPEPLLSAYEQAVPETTRTWLRPRATPRAGRQVGSGHLGVRIMSIGILVLLSGLVFVWWQSRESGGDITTDDAGLEGEAASSEISDSDPQQQAPAPASIPAPVPADTDLTEVPVAPPPPEPSITDQSPAPVDQPEPATAEQQSPAATAEEAPAEAETAADDTVADAEARVSATSEDADATADAGEIVMTFDAPCWVDVQDSEKKYKLFGEMKKGDRHVLEGKPPYSVILGNAAAATITVDGVAFDLSSISQGNVARFTLDPNESP
jgi:cytoskeleton protein RodZ